SMAAVDKNFNAFAKKLIAEKIGLEKRKLERAFASKNTQSIHEITKSAYDNNYLLLMQDPVDMEFNYKLLQKYKEFQLPQEQEKLKNLIKELINTIDQLIGRNYTPDTGFSLFNNSRDKNTLAKLREDIRPLLSAVSTANWDKVKGVEKVIQS